jgi:NAD(P)-dependent dehydrogenase (short-subunit alcohol dehydrogenase family)
MDLGLTGKVALVTGASRGIGKAIALGLAAEGCRVGLVARTREAVESAAAEVAALGVEALPIVADVAVAADIERMIEAVAARWGRLDVLVNNVGGRRGGAFLETTDADWLGAFELNVLSAIRASRAAVPHLRRQGGGAIVMVSSMFALAGWMNMAHYSAAKGAVLALAKSLARELGPDNIRVNAVGPGLIRTPMTERSQAGNPQVFAERAAGTPLRRLTTVEEVAATIAYLASPAASSLTGQCLSPSSGEVFTD